MGKEGAALKKPPINPAILDNFWLILNLPFLDKLILWMTMSQLQKLLDEMGYPDLL